jgi:hypothetical protein
MMAEEHAPSGTPAAVSIEARLLEVLEQQRRDTTAIHDRQQTLLEQNNALIAAMHEAPERQRDEGSSKPKYRKPERFSGKQSELKTFISHLASIFRLDPRAYPTDAIKIETLGTYLEGAPHDWFVVLRNLALEAEIDPGAASSEALEALLLLTNWNKFIQKLEAAYGDPTPHATAENQLRNLRQTGAASVYAQRWRTIAQTLPLSEYERVKRFREGLKTEVKDVLSLTKPPESLDEFIDHVVVIDKSPF